METRRIKRSEIRRILNEGIDINHKTHEVSYNPTHENNVETSLNTNPTVDKKLIPGVEVWSIFRRKDGDWGDGNPLIYALQGEHNWHFRTYSDKLAIDVRFSEIAEKFVQRHPFDITVVVPSSNDLNRRITDVIMHKSDNAKLLTGFIRKMRIEEADYIVSNDMNCAFRRKYNDDFQNKYSEFCSYLRVMEQKCGGYFTRHYIQNQEMRNVLDFTFKVTKEYDTFAKDINGRNILVIDDAISRGQSVKEVCDIIRSGYKPHSITVLTLVSKKYKS